MVSDSGSAADFSYSDLSDADLRCIRDSSLVALLCLNHNRAAADLASDLFEMVRQESSALTFMDMGDPSGNPGIVKPLVNNVIREGLVDIVSMNENEARWFLVALEDSTSDWSQLSGKPELWLRAAERVSAETGVRVDLHTPHFSASVKGSHSVAVPTFSEASRVVCGAGDSWNAGDILGTLMNVEVEDRLVLANAVAAKYVSSPDARHPTREEVMTYLRSSPSISYQGKRLLGIQ
jgi:hypothetical protein